MLDIRGEPPISFCLVHRNSDFNGTIDLAVKHKISPDDAFVLFHFVHIFSKVEFDFSKHVLLY